MTKTSLADREETLLRIEYSKVKYRNKIRFPHAQMVSFQEFEQISKAPCHYCNEPPSRTLKDKVTGITLNINGLDRVDNEKGYTPDNVVACCPICNDAKRRMTRDEFLAWLHRAGKYRFQDARKET